MSRRSSRQRRQPPMPARRNGPRRTSHSPAVVECLRWGVFAAIIVPVVLRMTGGSIRTAILSGVATAGLTAVIFVLAKLTRLRLPYLDKTEPEPVRQVDHRLAGVEPQRLPYEPAPYEPGYEPVPYGSPSYYEEVPPPYLPDQPDHPPAAEDWDPFDVRDEERRRSRRRAP